MANKRKSLSKRKSEIIGIRVTLKEKERIEKLARIQKITVTDLIKSLFDGLLDIRDQKTRLIWKILDRALELIEVDYLIRYITRSRENEEKKSDLISWEEEDWTSDMIFL